MTTDLRALYAWFKTQRKKLALKYPGKYALLNDKKVVEIFETELDAYAKGEVLFGLGNFLVQKCEENPEVLTFHSRAIF